MNATCANGKRSRLERGKSPFESERRDLNLPMSPFPNWPHPERFRTLDDAMAHLKKPDWRLCIPAFIEVMTPNGKCSRVNPEYVTAPYEQKIVRETQVRSLRRK